MCWSVEASVAVACLGSVGAAVSYYRNDPPAIWLTIGYFTVMEALQVAGYVVVDQCGTSANTAVTIASYLHIAFQPLFINAFAMELVPPTVKARVWRGVMLLSLCATAIMLIQLMPLDALGTCAAGTALCGTSFCTVSGDWHIAWNIPYNGLFVPIEVASGVTFGFPAYILAAFVLPLAYGAWRFVVFHALAGPILASSLTNNPNEMPAIWCLFSIFIVFVGMSMRVRDGVTTTTWWGRRIEA